MSRDALRPLALQGRSASAPRSRTGTVSAPRTGTVTAPRPASPRVEPVRLYVEEWPARSAQVHVRPSAGCRVLNVLVAALGLLLSAPLMLIIAVAIKCTSPGRVFFTQKRIGLDRRRGDRPPGNLRRHYDLGGRPFNIYKFRTMVENGGHDPAIWADPNDPRTTRVGRLLRVTRLDELPQLLNVLKGDMNVVGPRPEQPEIFARLRSEIPGYAARQRVLPGITGRSQIKQDYDRCLDDVRRKVRFDLEYIGRQSWVEDLRIMLATVPVMLFRRGGW